MQEEDTECTIAIQDSSGSAAGLARNCAQSLVDQVLALLPIIGHQGVRGDNALSRYQLESEVPIPFRAYHEKKRADVNIMCFNCTDHEMQNATIVYIDDSDENKQQLLTSAAVLCVAVLAIVYANNSRVIDGVERMV